MSINLILQKNCLDDGVHHNERFLFIEEIAKMICKWRFARLFAECIDKIFYDPSKQPRSVEELAFEQLVTRIEIYLKNISFGNAKNKNNFGLLIHDNNPTVAKKLTDLMKTFHNKGTLWIKIQNIIETPLFVNSELTSMIQLADLCSYSLRRYLENNNEQLFNYIFQRADRKDGKVVGIRHLTNNSCQCKICLSHRNIKVKKSEKCK